MESTSDGSEPNIENWLEISCDTWAWEYSCAVSWCPIGYIDCCCCALVNMCWKAVSFWNVRDVVAYWENV